MFACGANECKDNECEDDTERLQIAKSIIELNRMTMETKFAELVSSKMSVDHFN